MVSYIKSLKNVKIGEVVKRRNSLSASSFKDVNVKNKNFLKLGVLLTEKTKGFEPGSEEYINFSNNYFLRIQDMDRIELSFGQTDSTIKIIPPKKASQLTKVLSKGDICYQTASDVGNVCIYRGEKAFYNSHIRRLGLTKNKYYIFSLLKSSLCKGQVDISGSIKGIDNFSEDLLLDTKIFFPTKNNNSNPLDVENLVSLITQNILDKEEQINLKNQKINALIEKELKNQKKNKFYFKFPKKEEVKEWGRLDCGVYSRFYKNKEFKITNYLHGYSGLTELGFDIRRGQNLQLSNIGLSIYSEERKDNFYKIILSKYFGERYYKKYTYLGNKNKLKEIKKGEIIFSCRGEMGRAVYFPEQLNNLITNIDNVHIFPLEEKEEFESGFLFCFLGYLKNEGILDSIACTGSGAPSFTGYQFSKLKIPNFPKDIKEKIHRLYHNPIEKLHESTQENYLTLEKSRNSDLGIFQLNLEIIWLKEILDDLIWKISNEEKIDISSYY